MEQDNGKRTKSNKKTMNTLVKYFLKTNYRKIKGEEQTLNINIKPEHATHRLGCPKRAIPLSFFKRNPPDLVEALQLPVSGATGHGYCSAWCIERQHLCSNAGRLFAEILRKCMKSSECLAVFKSVTMGFDPKKRGLTYLLVRKLMRRSERIDPEVVVWSLVSSLEHFV